MISTDSRETCPVCDSDLPANCVRCSHCQTDPRMFDQPAEIAADFYNQGLDLAKTGDRQGAMDKMRGALAADAGLIDAYIVLGKLLAQAGRTADYEQAVQCWQEARRFQPTPEQARKLDHCVVAANNRIRAARDQAETARRGRTAALFGGGLGAALMCGIAGYLFRPGLPSGAGGPARAAGLAAGPRLAGAPVNPVAAINEALHRPDIRVGHVENTVVLRGTVQTEAEQAIILSAAAYAAHLPESAIDGSLLKVKKTFAPVAARRIEHMLRLVVNRLGPQSSDPLHGAKLAVAGSADHRALLVSGSCQDARAGREVARLIKEIYPTAAPVDSSGLLVQPDARESGRVTHATDASEERRSIPSRTRLASASRLASTASTGDQVYINLSTKTYTVQPGDTVYSITHKYGRGTAQWQELWQTNRAALHKPNTISAGTVLKLPSGWKTSRPANDDNE